MLTDKHLDAFVKAPPDVQAKAFSLLEEETRQAIAEALLRKGLR